MKEQTEIGKNNSSGTGSTSLEKFMGDHNRDIISWLESFDCYAAFHNWSDECKSAALPLFLENSAKIYYSSLTPETKQNFGATAEVLHKQFGAETLKFLERQALFSKRMGPGDNLEAYIDYVRKKVYG